VFSIVKTNLLRSSDLDSLNHHREPAATKKSKLSCFIVRTITVETIRTMK
jgi:hypothetical protein